MATSIIAKSVFRINENIQHGYGEVPATYCPETGKQGWGLPGGVICFDEKFVKEYAKKLHEEIVRVMGHPDELLQSHR